MKVTTPLFRTTMKELPEFEFAVRRGLKEAGIQVSSVIGKPVFSNAEGTIAVIEVNRKGLENPKVYHSVMHSMFKKIFGLESIPNTFG